MKITKLLLFAVAIFAFSCSKDDDAEPSLEKATLSFGESEVITAPTAMMQSNDPYAQMAAGWIGLANAQIAFTQVPDGATKLTTGKITASNGRSQADGDYVVYTWTDEQTGYTVAYQVSESADSYAFEVFLMLPDQTEYLKLLHAEEKKDRSSGFMNVYSIYGDDPSVIEFQYQWTRNGDDFQMTVKSPDGFLDITLDINLKTKAGSVVSKTYGVKDFEMTWDSEGNGTWTSYDEEGKPTTGSWEV